MEKIKKKTKKKTSLKKSFFCAMLITVAVILIMSAAAIGGCIYLQKLILPDSDEIYLNITTIYDDGTEDTTWQRMEFGQPQAAGRLVAVEDGVEVPERKGITSYSVDKVENSYQNLSPKRKLAYSAISYAIVILPSVFSVAGVFICALWFYKRKLDGPIHILSEATENIANENLDFTVSCDHTDEMGRLCDSFEKMRQTLYDNNRALWSMLEERRMLQASVAHDLRNPIAIIQGYTEYLEEAIPAGRITEAQLMHTVSNMQTTAKRLERYTDSILKIHQVEDMEIHKEACDLQQVLREITEDFGMMARQEGLTAEAAVNVPPGDVLTDRQMLYRLLENIYANALRFAETSIRVEFTMKDALLTAVISDDGCGFSEKVLKAGERYMITTDTSGGHMGMGLTVTRILCGKLGGGLKLSNGCHGGAVVEVYIMTENVSKRI